MSRPKLSAEHHRERQRAYQAEQKVRSVFSHKTRCVCPRCECEHVAQTYHIGVEPARKFCRICNYWAERDYDDTISVGYGDR